MKRTLALIGVGAALAAPSMASAADPVATAIRIGDHAGQVRVVLDRTSTPALAEYVVDSNPRDGGVIVDIPATRIGTLRPVRLYDVLVVPTQRGRTLRLTMTFDRMRFKYYGDTRLTKKVVMDLYKMRPRFPAATVRDAGCLVITYAQPRKGSIVVRGIGRNIFENQFSLVVRNARGRVAGSKPGVIIVGSPLGTWSATVRYTSTRNQGGTLEAVDFGGRTGHLCLAQIATTLRATG